MFQLKIKFTGIISGLYEMITYIDQYVHKFQNKGYINSTQVP